MVRIENGAEINMFCEQKIILKVFKSFRDKLGFSFFHLRLPVFRILKYKENMFFSGLNITQ